MLLWDRLEDTPGVGVLRTWDGGRFVVTPWSEILRRARGTAALLRQFGVGPGTTVACVLGNSSLTVSGLLGVWFAGAAIASLPLPGRGTDPKDYARQLGSIVASLGAPLVLVERRIAALVPDAFASRVRCWESLEWTGATAVTPPGPNDVAFVQFSSGSTDSPKGCVLTTAAISEQLAVLRDMFDPGTRRDSMGSWLPLSHDMGMFGALVYPLCHDHDLVLSTPERFVMAPRTWFQDLADFECTMTVGTTTGLRVAARAHERTPLRGTLALTDCVIGAERVDLGMLCRTQETFADNGLAMSAFMPAYGMAEATLAVTAQPWWRERPDAVVLDAIALADGELVPTAADDPHATTVVSTGPPCAGISVAVAQPDRLSEIRVSSPCLAKGYYADPARTTASFVDGEFHTGDLGFVRNGELFVVGRMDDLLTIGGRKVYARELEATVDQMEPVRHGRSVVLDLTACSAGELVLLVELKQPTHDYHAFAAAAAAAIMTKAGVELSRCLFLQQDALPRTPSGKVQRFRCRSLLLRDELSLAAVVDL
jgi:acyl-CoA synthetase (AMP-forming)/AMP-acid ligase II